MSLLIEAPASPHQLELSQLLALAAAEGDAQREQTTDDHKGTWGQFFTGEAIASFMAELIGPPTHGESVRVLDPGAGTGVLGLAASCSLVRRGFSVRLVSVEAEATARARLVATMAAAEDTFGSLWSYDVRDDDVLDLLVPRLDRAPDAAFDVVIANPPYFKLSPTDARGGDAPNVYARFMEVGAALLRPGGQLVFIVPRSFASGLYFKRFRKRFHSSMTLEHVHVFDSRRDAFRDEQVLQENVIVVYRKGPPRGSTVVVSSSRGVRDLAHPRKFEAQRRELLHAARHGVLALPACDEDLAVMRNVRSWPSSLADLGLEISTGPVVPFRTDAMCSDAGSDTVPLLWLQHVRPGGVAWPLGEKFRKPEHIRRSADGKLLVANKTCLLMRRFSAKEEARRLTLAVMEGGKLPGDVIGLENHLNFIHAPRGAFSLHLAYGLAAVLSSSIVDAFFRIENGNTQVSATEIRALPLPDRATIETVGAQVQREGYTVLSDRERIDAIVAACLAPQS